MMTDAGGYAAYRFWFDIAQFVLTGMIAVYVWISKRDSVNNKRFTVLEKDLSTSLDDLEKKVDARMDNHSERITKVETECDHAPSHADLGQVYDRINEVSDQVANLTGGMEALKRSVDMIHQHLLNEGKK